MYTLHRCVKCHALWRLYAEHWSLYPDEKCGQCCDNVAMAEQIEPLGPVPSDIARFFSFSHLPERLQLWSRPFGELALRMLKELPTGSQLDQGLARLLEAKDCAVRAALPRS